MFLSKSDYMLGHNCHKTLWLKKNRKDLAPIIDAKTQANFDTGNKIQELARLWFKDGIMVDVEAWDVIQGSLLSEDLIKEHNIIFEAFAKLDWGAFCRIDVLQKNGNSWDLIEIKSSTKPKTEHFIDLAFQYMVFENAGYKIKDCYVLHLNSQYLREKELNIDKLFKLSKVSNEVFKEYPNVVEFAPRLYDFMQTKVEPKSKYCKFCQECPYWEYCKTEDKGKEKEPSKEDKAAINNFLSTLKYPLYYLDYETIMPAIPIFEKSRPYQQIPFQFSLHIQKEKGGTCEHVGFLHQQKTDPRRELAECLIRNCGKNGSVIAYNAMFEKARNSELAETFPDLADALTAINDRVVDQLVPFKKRALYHESQCGSASIKKVLPAFTDLAYNDMEIANGGEAMDRYLAFINDKLSAEEEKVLFEGLNKYCEQDTYAMVLLMQVLYERGETNDL